MRTAEPSSPAEIAWIRRDERSNYLISAGGVDYVESNLGSITVLYRLLKAAESGDALRSEQDLFGDPGGTADSAARTG